MPKTKPQYRSLQPDKVVETIAQLERRIGERFPGAGLHKVASELRQISLEAVSRAEAIRRPNLFLRLLIVLLIMGVLGLVGWIVLQVRLNDEIFQLQNLSQVMDSSLASTVLIGAAMAFLISLELRWKRRRALEALHELRSLAHIVDMHQLTKDPERMLHGGPSTMSSPRRNLTAFQLSRYLDYCSEMLSLTSKIGAIYVQDFPDAQALEAMDQLELLTSNLSRAVWQKIMMLDQIRDLPEEIRSALPVDVDELATRPTIRTIPGDSDARTGFNPATLQQKTTS